MTIEINTDVVTSGRRKIRALRWWMLALFLLGVTVNYITRNSLGLLAAELKTMPELFCPCVADARQARHLFNA